MKEGLWFFACVEISPAKNIYTRPINSFEPSECKILLQGKSSVYLGVSWQLPDCCCCVCFCYYFIFYQKVVLLEFLLLGLGF